MYTHKSLRASAAASGSDPAATTLDAVTEPHPSLGLTLLDGAWAEVLGHRSNIRAGVPGCTCGVTFSHHTTFTADHAQHLAGEVVRYVLGFSLRALETREETQGGISARALLMELASGSTPAIGTEAVNA